MDLTGRARRWNRCGYVVLLIVGAAWHFLFDLSGQNVVVGALTPVNESVWEHGKILLFPICLWWLLGMALIRPMRADWPQGDVDVERRQARWLLGACIAALTALAVMFAGYYTLTGALGVHALWLDLLIFALSLAAGQSAGVRAFAKGVRSRRTRIVAIALLAAVLACSIVFTYWTPQLPIFYCPVTQTYGLP